MTRPVYACAELTGATSYWFDRERLSHCATFLPRHNPPSVGGTVELTWPARSYVVAGVVDAQARQEAA